ncbi:MAG TPA: hypothetical protein ENM98_05065 [Halothiobacillaceae bacterium]|nr:hypothetical protein [Halothiobacillaceae bacterium]
MANIFGIGNVTLDIINEVQHYPVRDSEQRALTQRVRVGGNVANTLTVLRQFDHQCQLGASVGVDTDGERIIEGLQAADIGLDYLKRPKQGHTPTSHIILDRETGARTIVHYRELPEYDLPTFLKAEHKLAQFDWIHFEARAMEETKSMLALAREVVRDQPVSLEVEKDRDLLDQVWGIPDIIFFSKHFAQQRGFSDPRAFLEQAHQWAPQAQLVLGWGNQGAFGFFSQNKEPLQHRPPSRKLDVIDSVGAGDTLIAGFIHARLQQMDHRAALAFAVNLAERKLEQIGFTRLGPADPQNKPDLL